jgi:hypothetical protein
MMMVVAVAAVVVNFHPDTIEREFKKIRKKKILHVLQNVGFNVFQKG